MPEIEDLALEHLATQIAARLELTDESVFVGERGGVIIIDETASVKILSYLPQEVSKVEKYLRLARELHDRAGLVRLATEQINELSLVLRQNDRLFGELAELGVTLDPEERKKAEDTIRSWSSK